MARILALVLAGRGGGKERGDVSREAVLVQRVTGSRLWLRGKEEEVLALLVTGGTDGGEEKKLSTRDYQFYEK